MAMSDEHKAALAKGRTESRAIKAYLQAINRPKRRGRPVTKETVTKRITDLAARIDAEPDDLKKVELIQSKLDAEATLAALADPVDLSALEVGFVEHVASYSDRKEITYPAWREAGVPATVLRSAGIKQVRSTSS